MNTKELYKGLIKNYKEILKQTKDKLVVATGLEKLQLRQQIEFIQHTIEELENELAYDNKTLVCKKCYFKNFCYAKSQDRTQCDSFAKKLSNEYEFYLDRIDYLEKLKETATGTELNRILAEIDQLEDFAIHACQDMAIGPVEITDELPF